jgi:outer membrane receptor protein involved in Fe transport
MTWDLTAEVKVHKNLTLMAGINNLFDESYYARVRNDGIDPAYGRNFYLGGMVSF